MSIIINVLWKKVNLVPYKKQNRNDVASSLKKLASNWMHTDHYTFNTQLLFNGVVSTARLCFWLLIR
jgi:hypothetical protein